jgi:5'-3' exonuclease
MIKYDKVCKVVIITGDHDYLQLLDEEGRVDIFDLKCKSLKDKSLGNSKKDLLHKILIGDKSDNIKAIHTKLGPKTALKYIDNENELKKKLEDLSIKEKFELNSILIDMDKIPDKFKENIQSEFSKLWIKILSNDFST